jgi:glycosyltransferase involved in cell wall biosynthesis
MEPYIHFAGFRADVRRMLSSADAFCLPSVLEALPIAILEACACRLPLLTTSVGDMPELFSHGRSAFLVPPGDVRALAEGLVYLRDHPEERFRMADEAHAVVGRTLSPETMIDRTLELYRGDLGKKT